LSAPRFRDLHHAGIPAERQADLWDKLGQTLTEEMSTLRSLSADEDVEQVREIIHRIAGTASWFRLEEVALAANRLEQCLSDGDAPQAELRALEAAVARIADECLEMRLQRESRQ
jgi:HPt (histidine-containing phosphotransfer) domain-containing protein